MQSTQFKELLRRYLANQCSSAEKAFVENWYNQHTIENTEPLTAAEYEEDIAFIHNHLGQSGQQQKNGQHGLELQWRRLFYLPWAYQSIIIFQESKTQPM